MNSPPEETCILICCCSTNWDMGCLQKTNWDFCSFTILECVIGSLGLLEGAAVTLFFTSINKTSPQSQGWVSTEAASGMFQLCAPGVCWRLKLASRTGAPTKGLAVNEEVGGTNQAKVGKRPSFAPVQRHKTSVCQHLIYMTTDIHW